MSSAEQLEQTRIRPPTGDKGTTRQRSPREADAPSPPAPATGPKRRWTRIALILAILVVLAGGGWWFWGWWTHGRFVQSTDDATLQADGVTVSARVSGLVEETLVTDNQTVEAGQVLVRIDDRDPRARLEAAVAQTDEARAGIARTEAQISQQEAQVAQAEAALAGAQAQLAFADKEANRYGRLAGTGAETGESFDQMKQRRDQARAQTDQDAAALLSAKRQIATLQAQLKQSEAQIEQAEAQGRAAQVDLDATLVRARIAGRIGDKSVQAGQYVQTGTRLMSVVPMRDLYIVANFKETQMRDMRVGQPATIEVDALGGHVLHGAVESIAPGTGAEFALIPANNATGNFTKIVQRVGVRIRTAMDAQASAVLVAGMSVTVAVDTIDAADPSRAPADHRVAEAAAAP